MKRTNWLVMFLVFILSLIVGYYIFITSSLVRFWADDFCTSTAIRDNGFWSTQVSTWNGWTGRYSATFAISFVEIFGLTAFKLLPTILFLLFLIPIVLFTNVAFAVIVSVVTLLNSPNIIQTFYWSTGSLNYFVPFVFLNLFLLNVFKIKYKYKNIISFVLVFIASGFSESFAVANLFFLVFMFLVFSYVKISDIKIIKRSILVGILTTALSLVVMYIAPGNSVRSSLVSHPESFYSWLKDVSFYTRWFLISRFQIDSFLTSLAVVFLLPSVVTLKLNFFTKPKVVLFLSLLFIPLITITVVGLTYYALNWEPPERVMMIATTFIFYAFVIFSYAFWQIVKLKKTTLLKFLFIVSLIFLIFYTNKYLGINKKELAEYAFKWDRLETKIINSSSGIVEIENIKPVGKMDGFIENKGWVLSCIKGYYQTRELIVK